MSMRIALLCSAIVSLSGPLVVFACNLVVPVTHLSSILATIALLPWLTGATALVLITAWNLCVRKWRLAIVSVLLPIAFVADPYLRLPMRAAHYLDFLALRPSYDRQIAMLPRKLPRIVEFYWGTYSPIGIVYDETDQIARPDDRRTFAWNEREKHSRVMCGGTTLVGRPKALGNHYYVARFAC